MTYVRLPVQNEIFLEDVLPVVKAGIMCLSQRESVFQPEANNHPKQLPSSREPLSLVIRWCLRMTGFKHTAGTEHWFDRCQLMTGICLPLRQIHKKKLLRSVIKKYC